MDESNPVFPPMSMNRINDMYPETPRMIICNFLPEDTDDLHDISGDDDKNERPDYHP